MNDFMAWLKRVAGPRITIHFHAPVVFNLFGGKRVGKLGKDRRIPALLGNAPPQAQRPCLKIGLASLRRDRMLVQADPRIRAGWQAVTAEIFTAAKTDLTGRQNHDEGKARSNRPGYMSGLS